MQILNFVIFLTRKSFPATNFSHYFSDSPIRFSSILNFWCETSLYSQHRVPGQKLECNRIYNKRKNRVSNVRSRVSQKWSWRIFSYIEMRKWVLFMAERCKNYQLYQKIVHIQVVENWISYKKAIGRTSLSHPRVELGARKIDMVQI